MTDRPVHEGASARIAAFATGFDSARLSAADHRAIGRSAFDTLAVALAGRAEPATLRARAYGQGFAGTARLWGSNERLHPEAAALVNGVAGHVLDYDDVSSPMRGHPSIALWPALLALADARDLPGARVASAFAVGFEVIVKLARAMAVEHYARGWHSTSTLGVIGATAALSHLAGLGTDATVHALGLAVAQAAGSRQNFGADAKSFQAGACNAAALRAVLLAEQGFTAAPDALDGGFGYTALYGRHESLLPELDTLGGTPLELHASGFEIKQYPMCYAAHRAIDGLLAMRRAHGLRLDAVDALEVHTSRNALTPLIHHRPQTGLQGKFSLEYAMAAALADGEVRLASFDDAAVQRPALQDFFPRVQAVEAADGPALPRWTELRLRLRGNGWVTRRIDTQHGAADDPLTDDELCAKGADCLAFARCPIDAAALFDLCGGLASRPARALLQALETDR